MSAQAETSEAKEDHISLIHFRQAARKGVEWTTASSWRMLITHEHKLVDSDG